ncbi:universal stress protein [Natrarchaeobaculum sulfurireducens]|uniref:Nucleotide-binding protein, UspA family n=1 Tax=Natrarchaeobaculum sulfurireducens TaxID=2044521 RepID=A0A346PCI8_9EURY|nr:universal stress protein [Natrarchaeobaculum sulfurireducens]AXR77233.1 Nucleotide-binding protein, UspA family [Natrarchaeobaculum sulfurireducens]AXR82804.1 Universal stress protein [Natrarchaeobaculum sulfurireducens]
MPEHVLVPVDDSDQSTEALEFACREYPDTKITALHVLDPRGFYGVANIQESAETNYEALETRNKERAEELLEEAREQAAALDREIETEHAVGVVADSIVEYAADHDVDHITIGSHGRTGASRILLGSVAETVARRSPVPVAIVR